MKEKLIGNIGIYIIVNVKKTNFLKITYLLYWSHVFLHRRMKSVVFDWFTSSSHSSKSFQSHIDKKSEIKQNVTVLYLLFKNLKNRWYYIYHLVVFQLFLWYNRQPSQTHICSQDFAFSSEKQNNNMFFKIINDIRDGPNIKEKSDLDIGYGQILCESTDF